MTKNHFLTHSYGNTEITGGQDITSNERILLDVVAAISDSIEYWGVVIPDRYALDSHRIQRHTGKFDELVKAAGDALQTSYHDVITVAVAVLAENGSKEEQRVCKEWRFPPMLGDVKRVNSLALRTSTSDEDIFVEDLRQRIPVLRNESGAVDVSYEQKAKEPAPSELALQKARAYFDNLMIQEGYALEVGPPGYSFIDENYDEVSVHSHSKESKKAYKTLRYGQAKNFSLPMPLSNNPRLAI